MSRIKLGPEERRGNDIHVRLTKEETRQLDEMALYLDKTRSEMARTMLKYCYKKYSEYGETFE